MSQGSQVLLLGAGFVCEPAVQVLSNAGVHVTVACRTLAAAQSLTKFLANTTAIELDAGDHEALSAAVGKVDLVVSLIPYTLHPAVVKAAIKHKKPVVTTSYISPALWELDQESKDAGITVLNEIGLDPGIDHLYAVKTIDEVHRAGGKITSFTSYCGGLPAPANANNPLGYKFSWSPRGGLLALLNPGQWYQDGQVAKVEGKDLMASAKPQSISEDFELVGYPNRDSVSFREFYAIPEARTVFRGTLRYSGYPEIIRTLISIGYFSQDRLISLSRDNETPPTWLQLTAQLLNLEVTATQSQVRDAISSKAQFLESNELSKVLSGLEWIGILNGIEPVAPRDTPLDTLCEVLQGKMAYADGERDMVVLQHVFEIEHADGREEKRSSTLVEYGEPIAPGYRSAMAKLVGLPCAVGVLAVLEGKISLKGMVAPWSNPAIAAYLTDQLRTKHAIELTEEVIG
ncbi:saccharopine reductase, partial [Aureobasidium melanogenum]